MSDNPAPYTALFDPAVDAALWVPPLDDTLTVSRETLAEVTAANIHDPIAMVRAAVALEMRLRQLVAALDKEAGR